MIKFTSDSEINASKDLNEDEKKRAKAKLRGIKASNARKTKAGKTSEVKTVELVANSLKEMKELLQPKKEIDINDANGFNSALISSAKHCMKEGATKEEILELLHNLYNEKVDQKTKRKRLF